MGLVNALFAPFIVVYLLMYSFFRYFEVSRPDTKFLPVRTILSYGLDGRNITRIRRRSGRGNIPPTRAGNFASLTSYLIYLRGGSTKAMSPQSNTSTSSPKLSLL